jgi:hypothetical protein
LPDCEQRGLDGRGTAPVSVSAARTCLVHLVWAPLGPAPLESFTASYRRHDAGAAHELVVLLNGFAPDQDLSPWRKLLGGVEHEELRLGRPLLDLAAYAEAHRRIRAERYCFVNSWGVLLADDWLGAMDRALSAPGVGLVGATGSWGSIRSYQRFMLGLGGAYGRVFPDRRSAVEMLEAIAGSDPGPAPPAAARRGIPGLAFARALLGQARGFAPFPAHHVRTSSFMLAGAVLDSVGFPAIADKNDTYRLESGRNSMTAQVERLGLSAVVAGRDGIAYRAPDWPASRTFWQGEQENLLIADKQTAYYARGSHAEREALARYAWGDRAEVPPAGRPRP